MTRSAGWWLKLLGRQKQPCEYALIAYEMWAAHGGNRGMAAGTAHREAETWIPRFATHLEQLATQLRERPGNVERFRAHVEWMRMHRDSSHPYHNAWHPYRLGLASANMRYLELKESIIEGYERVLAEHLNREPGPIRAWALDTLAKITLGVSSSTNLPRSRITRPPGGFLLHLAEFAFSKRTFERVLEPTLLDLQQEYFDALESGRRLKAEFARVRGYIAFWTAIAATGIGKFVSVLLRRAL